MVGLYNECDEESIVNLVNMGASVIIIAFSVFVVCRFGNNGGCCCSLVVGDYFSMYLFHE